MTESFTSDKDRPNHDLLASPNLSLELNGDQFRELVGQAVERLAPFLDSLADQPLQGDAKEIKQQPLPEKPAEFATLLDELFEQRIPQSYNTPSPGYLAYVPGGGLPHAAIADLIADTVNRYVSTWFTAPQLVRLEADVVDWFCRIVGLPDSAGGLLTTGGSLANWIALVTARELGKIDDLRQATVYVSDQAHSSVAKAARLAGVPLANVRSIRSDRLFRICIEDLEKQIADDLKSGLIPLAIVGNAGTTNTGAVDSLESLSRIAQQQNIWFHVDAAYGGFFMLTERGQQAMRGIELADSVTLDPHKGFFLPYGNGCLLVRRKNDLRLAHQESSDYLPEMPDESGRVDFCQISPELSRDLRGLRIWLPLKMHGVEPFRQNLKEKLDLCHWAAKELQLIDGIEIVAQPQLSTLAFRLCRPDDSDEQADAINRLLCDRINESRRILLSPTILNGRFVVRICVLSFRTHFKQLKICLEEIRSAVEQMRVIQLPDTK